jgi:hypothetical protein
MISTALKPIPYKIGFQHALLAFIPKRMKNAATSDAETSERLGNGGKFYRFFLSCLLFVTFGAGIGSGAIAFCKKLEDVYLYASPTLSNTINQQVMEIERYLPDNESLICVAPDSNAYVIHILQRALYPRPVFKINANKLLGPDGSSLRAKYGIHYAIAVDMPPLKPNFINPQKIGPADAKPSIVIGEIAP